MSIVKKVISYVRHLPLKYSLGGGAAIVVVLVLGVHMLTRSGAADALPPQVSHVRIASVASLSSQTAGPLPVTGTVTSLNEAVILAQSSGEVVVLNRELGDYVSAGTIIAQLENSSQRAAVLQAQGAYDAAQAIFANTSGTNATNSGISAAQAKQNVINAQNAADTSLQGLYSVLDDAVHTKADLLFVDPHTNPKLILTVSDSQLLITLQNERGQLDLTLANASTLANKTSRTDTDADIAAMNAHARLISTFLNNLVDAVNKSIPSQTVSASQIAAFQASVGVARTSVTSAVAALAGAKVSYDNAVASAAAATNTAGTGTSNSISIAEANVTQAQGALNAARATLEKTIIRSPISGTIVSLPLTRGGFVSMATQVAQVSNPSALEVKAYVTPNDAKTLAVGGAAIIGEGTQGVIVSIAPALDPTTGKILVTVGIVGSQSALTDGETTTVSIARATAAQKPKVKNASTDILIPIIAAKITPEGPIAFTVSSSTLQQIPITLGTILGSQVTVLTGLTGESVIVTDARGLSNGQTVVVDTH
ncbi:MAG: HlyD family efflux transporter periplasmic adaptor subunit [Candidatus Adlerbacteria bacterium]